MNKLEVIRHCEHETYAIVELVTDKTEDEAKKFGTSTTSTQSLLPKI